MAATAVVLPGAAAIGGYALGQAEAPSAQDTASARSEEERVAEPAAYKRALSGGRRRGLREGGAEGLRQGRRGVRAGKRGLALRQAQVGRETQEKQTACPPGQQILRQMDAVYCGRPGAARPENCPPGEVPVGQTGACAPRE